MERYLKFSYRRRFSINVETIVQQRGYFADDVCSADTVIKRINTYGWKRILVDLKVINGQLFKGWVDKPKGNVYVAVDYHDIQAISRRNVIGNRGRKNAMMRRDSFLVINNVEPIVSIELFPQIL